MAFNRILDFSNGLDFYLGFFFTPTSSLTHTTILNHLLTTLTPPTIQPIPYPHWSPTIPALLLQNFFSTSSKKMSILSLHCQ